MSTNSNVLIIENNYSNRAKILQTFKDHQLRHRLLFVNDCKEALTELYFFNKEITSISPQIVLISFSPDIFDFLDKLKSDHRYKQLSVFILTENSCIKEKEKLKFYKVNGIVDKSLDFKNFSNETYLDTLDLFLQLLRITLDKSSQYNIILNSSKPPKQ